MPLRIFYASAPEDQRHLQALERHLGGLEREGLIAGWHERLLFPGQDRQRTLEQNLDNADIIVLLISSDFFASTTCRDVMQRALKLMQSGKARVVPVMVRAVDWENSPLYELQPIPKNGRPIRIWDAADRAWMEVASELRSLISGPSSTKASLHHTRSEATENRQVEVGIIITLADGFKELYSQIGSTCQVIPGEHPTERYYRFTSPGPDPKRPYVSVATLISTQESSEAASAVQRLNRRFNPSSIILLGVAAGIDANVRLGDVVVATRVERYLESVKWRSPARSEHRVMQRTEAEAFQPSYMLLNRLRNFEFTHSELHQRWQTACSADLEAHLPTEERKRLRKERLLSDQVRLFDGHVASTPAVTTSETLIRWLRQQDPRCLAVEMETYGLNDAMSFAETSIHALLLRGVADVGDRHDAPPGRPSSLALRRIATRNCIRLLFAMLEAGIVPRAG